MKGFREIVEENKTYNKEDIKNLVNSAVDLMLSVDLSQGGEVIKKTNRLEDAIKKLGFKPRSTKN